MYIEMHVKDHQTHPSLSKVQVGSNSADVQNLSARHRRTLAISNRGAQIASHSIKSLQESSFVELPQMGV